MKTHDSHANLLHLLQAKEASNEVIKEEEILRITGWKESTFRTYLSKDQLSDFICEIENGIYEASNTIGLTDIEFTKLLSQSKHRRSLGHNCKSRLAKALLRKSKDNMLLALELYNRPSLENRLDGFVLCFCIAWEQLLKSILIEEKGEKTIYKNKNKTTGFHQTLSLRECVERVYSADNLIRKNIEKIALYRDHAVHLLMPEVQGIMSRVFQSGILNYSTEFQRFSETSFISSSHSGMISLVGDIRSVSNRVLYSNYGKSVGIEIASLIEDLEKEVDKLDDIQFAIPLDVKLVFAKEDKDGGVITLAKAEDGMEGLRRAIVVEKPTERSETHPYRESSAIKEINSRLYLAYSEELLNKHLPKRNKDTGKPEINSHCFRSVAEKLKWRRSNNKYHYKSHDPEYHYYSDSAIDEFISKIMSHDKYLEKAKSDYSYHQKKKR